MLPSNDPAGSKGFGDRRGIAGVGWIRNTRHVDNKNDKTTTEDHYFIYSLKAQAKGLLRIKREHYDREQPALMPDMAFYEDDCRESEERGSDGHRKPACRC